MEFAIRNLSVLAYAQGFTLWHYRARGATLENIRQKGFFDSASDMLAAGDMLMISADDAGSVVLVTSASETGGVTVSSLCQ